MKYKDIRDILMEHELKVTPQRIAVLEAVSTIPNHPTTDKIIDFIKKNHPNIAIGTIYKILDTFVANGIIQRVKTDRDVMHYDAILEKHHHLYCSDSDQIADYVDEELDQMLEKYFKKKQIPGFKIDDIKLQINGKFKNQKES